MKKKKLKPERLFIIRKTVMACSVSEALKKEKKIDPEEIYPAQEKKGNRSTYAVVFNAELPDEYDDSTD